MAVVGEVVGSGGIGIGGAADVVFVHGSLAALSNVVLEWDVDNDGDFSESVEDITGVMVEMQTRIGRDWPSQLTGRAGPGELKARLRNDDNRFSVFNASSPLNQAPNSLDLGRKLRARVAEAANPDPALLARDRFRQDGPLTTAETGQAWEQPGATFQIVDGAARATTLGAGHVAVVDTGSTDHYVQVATGRNALTSGNDNAVGLIFRYVDEDNLSIFQARANSTSPFLIYELIDIVAGAATVVTSFFQNFYERTTLAAHVHDDEVDLYLEGVRFATGEPAINGAATRAGIWSQWATGTASIPPELTRFDVWDDATALTEGVLWTGDVADIHPSAALGPDRTAALTGEGSMSKLATERVRFPGLAFGHTSDVAMGKVLADSSLLHPPGRIGGGFVAPATSAIGLNEADAIEVARLFEDHEGGFLFEAQEGWLDYEGRNARTGRPVEAVFSDEKGAQFGYYKIELLGWRREIFNEIRVGIGHQVPSPIAVAPQSHGDIAVVDFNLGSGIIQEGDLLIGFATCSGSSGTDVTWVVPPGWVHLTSDKPLQTAPTSDGNNYRIYAKIADGTESGILNIAQASANLAFVSQVWIIRDWFGDIGQGVTLGDESFDSDPPPVSPPWAPQAALILAVRWGRAGDATVADWSKQAIDGFYLGFETLNQDTAGRNVALQSATKFVAAADVIDPAAFDGEFSGFLNVVTRALAIRGTTLTPGESSGVTQVTLTDTESVDRHNATKTFTAASNFYQPNSAGEAAATDYGEAILAHYSQNRPIVRIAFHAHTNQAYRNQAIRRRVGHKIRLVSTSEGIDNEMFIENIYHHFADGGTIWDVIWELSPA